MARSGVAALSFAVLLAVFEIGSCTSCYQCNSQNDPSCADYFNKKPSLLVDCTREDVVTYNNQFVKPLIPSELNFGVLGATRLCHKIITQSGTVVRACLDANPLTLNHTCTILEAQNQRVDDSRKIKHCSVCEKDGCNGAGSASISLPLGALALIASYLYYKQ